MEKKPAQQPEVILPTSPPPANTNQSTNSGPPPLNANTTNPPPPPGINPKPPAQDGAPISKVKSFPKAAKISLGIGMAIFILFLLGLAGTTALNLSKPKPTPTPPFVNKPSPTPPLTATWRTYSNEKYGFEIKYPHEFTLENELFDQKFEYSDGADIRNFNRVTRFSNPNATWIQIEALYTTNEIANVGEWIKNDYPTVNRNGTSSGALKNIVSAKAAGQDTIVFEDGQGETRKNVVFYRDKRMIIITLFPIAETGGSYADKKESVNYLDQMLSTFRFTDISFVPINQNILFELPADWKVLEETRDRLYISNLNATRIIKFFKKTNISKAELENQARKKIISNFRSQGTTIGGKFSTQYSGCQKVAGCNMIYITVVSSNNISYLIEYENNDKEEIFDTILKNVTIK